MWVLSVWNLYAMLGNDPVGRWDLWGMEESGEKGCESCKCCCAEKIVFIVVGRKTDLYNPDNSTVKKQVVTFPNRRRMEL
jgi:hypothetical protein